MRTLLVILLLLASRVACAQVARPWPRNEATGKIEFIGQLPWPANAKTQAARLALVRHWYLKKLTNVKVKNTQSLPAKSLTYGDLPKEVRIEFTTHQEWGNMLDRLIFEVHLLPTANGLSYRLSDFESFYIGDDNAGQISLESNLEQSPNGSLALTAFRKRLHWALSGW
ncbi:hypothetical protein GKZ68_20155 [Hymenobacter sp. BRD128]|uniref:hypothetical protein n=1 Tax=Hymenobacter sp. BRD128 TaxID=2675878 RepID=UPI0015649209|nr:hypothetical protein [Hymenobacter sp. BRD128]QKG58737.1 hypothetical protein GKZ68_20155 [Hymenobacter sp. BRD128]